MEFNKETKEAKFFSLISKPLKPHSLEAFVKELFRDLTRRSESKSKETHLSKLAFMESIQLPLIIAERLFYSFANDRNAITLSKDKYISGFISIYGDNFDLKLDMIAKVFDFDLDGVMNVDDITLLFAQFFILDNDMALFHKVKEIIHADLTPKKRLTISSFKEIILNYNADTFYLFLAFLHKYCPFTNEQVLFFNRFTLPSSTSIHQGNANEARATSIMKEKPSSSKLLQFTYLPPTETLISFLKFQYILPDGNETGISDISQPIINEIEQKEAGKEDDDLDILDSFEEDLNKAKATIISEEEESTSSSSTNQRHLSDVSSVFSFSSYGKSNTNDQRAKTDLCQFARSVNNSPVKYPSTASYDKSNSMTSGVSQFKKQHTSMTDFSRMNDFFEINVNYYTRSGAVRKCIIIVIDDCLFVHIFNGFTYKYLKIISLKFTFVEEIEHCETLTNKHLTRVKLTSLLNNFHKEIIFSCQDQLEMASFITRLKKLTHFRHFEDKYIKMKELYRGSLSQLYLGKEALTNQKVALKEVKQNQFGKSNKNEILLWEYDIMRYIQKTSHPNIVKVLDLFRTQEALIIILEYIQGGNLKNYLLDNRNLPLKEQTKIMFQIANAVLFLHSHGIVHRDLKPENILVNQSEKDSQIDIKLIDFGFSRVFGRLDYTNESYGTLNYASPEVLNRTPYSFKADIWSLGVIFYYITVGTHPFGEADRDTRKIQSNILNASYTIPERVDANHKYLITSCLQIEQKDRPKIDDIVKLLM